MDHHCAAADDGGVVFEALATTPEPLPSLVVHEPGRAADRREAEVGVVDAEQQAMLRA